MTFSLPPELSAFVDQTVAAGKFASPEDVVAAGLRLLQERAPELEELRKKLQEGLDDFERGDYIELNGDAEISRFVAEVFEQSCQKADALQIKK
jgi:antitoxin ParD1/3/4